MMTELSVLCTDPQVCQIPQMSKTKEHDLVRAGEITAIWPGRTRRMPTDRLTQYLKSP
ncbi:unannotated protein [freshwater metagenome]|uniref:Unannotated protein n=1 Tax=freshwater metagenome TaxID=449393 RepID=A0A6J7LI34_9ZZZZ